MAVEDAGLDPAKEDRDRFGVLVGSGIGGLGTLLDSHKTLLDKGPDRVSPFFIPMLIINMASGLISMRFGARGPNSSRGHRLRDREITPSGMPRASFNGATPT